MDKLSKTQLLDIAQRSDQFCNKMKRQSKKEIIEFITQNNLEVEENVDLNNKNKQSLFSEAKLYPDFKVTHHGKNKKSLIEFLQSKGTVSPIHVNEMFDLEEKLIEALNAQDFTTT